jgi:glycosyltransferase involved in cell wall biosynthesis
MPPGVLSAVVRHAVLRRSKAVVAVSREVAQRLAGDDWKRHGVVVIDNPVDTSRFDPDAIDRERARRELGVGPGPVLAVIAQITRWKGQTHAVRVLDELRRSLPAAELLLVGETKFVGSATRLDNRAYERELRELIADCGLEDAVRFLGEREDVERIFAALDVLLVPSSEEPFGRTIIEGLAMEIPVVATDIGGPPEIIRDTRDGELVPPRDVSAWVRAVERVLRDGQPTDRRAYAVERFSRDRHAAAVAELYASRR